MNKFLIQWNNPPKGFTLVELLVTLTVFTILLTIAIPSYNTFILNNRLDVSADTLVNGLNYARSIALSNNSNIQICPFSTPNSTTCGGGWSSGWIVLSQNATGGTVLLKSQEYSSKNSNISANVNSITFNSRGLASSQGNFSICDSRGGAFGRSVEVLTTGYIQSGDTPGQAVWNNGAITCP